MDTKSFSTRTERRVKENPRINGTHIIGLDMGYSGPKCFYENGNFVFPNFCKKIKGERFGDLNKSDIVYEDTNTHEQYWVGEMASKSLSEDSIVSEDTLFGRNHYLHPDFLITFRTALGIALWNTETDGSDVFLQTGLPPAYLIKDEAYLRSVIQREHQFKLTMGQECKSFNITLTADKIDIMRQPMGTFYSVVVDQNGNITPNISNYLNSNLMIFDGGFGTLDKFFVKGKELESAPTDPNLGMKRVLEETRSLFQADAKKDNLDATISIPAMQACLKSGKIKVNDMINLTVREYPIEKYLEEANQMVREEAFESIKDYIFDIKYLIMTGGTGAAWYPYFKERLQALELEVIPGNNNSNLPTVYANARGYYMYRLNQLKMRK